MPKRPNNTDQYIIMGRLGSRFGVQGWLRMQSFADPPNNLFNHAEWYIHHRGEWQSVKIANHQPHGDSFIVKLQGCNTPEDARLYANNAIAILRTQLPKLATENYYWSDLIGLQVVTEAGIELGIVDHLLETGSNDVIVIQGNRQHFLPFIDDAVKSIDLQQKKMIVDWDVDF